MPTTTIDTARATPAAWPATASQVLLTAADLEFLPSCLAQGVVKYELHDGVLVIMAPPGADHGRQQSLISHMLHAYVEDRGLGHAFAEVMVILRRNPDRVVAPDAAFILTASLPVQQSSEGYLETIPELVVEIRSKNDTRAELARKAQMYLDAGVQVVWLLDPMARILAVHRPDGSVQIVRDTDTLTCDLLPGFAVPLARILA